MDPDLIAFHPDPPQALMSALLILEVVGYAVVGHWPRTLALWLFIGAALTTLLAVRVASLVNATTADSPRLNIGVIALGLAASLVGMGLPIFGYRRSRSRPAA